MKKNRLLFILLFFSTMLLSCHQDFLDIKSDKKLVTPSSLKDLRALLDHYIKMNAEMPTLGEMGSDDYYLESDRFESLPLSSFKNAYIWAKDLEYDANALPDWDGRYEQIFYANTVLEGLDKIDVNDQNRFEYEDIKGSALFFRAWGNYQLAQIFCLPYDPETAGDDLGIPVRLESDINIPTARATVEQTYNQIRRDIEESITLLPDRVDTKTRPNKAAAYAFLARVELLTGNYTEAVKSASECLKLHSALMDFNDVDFSRSYPIQQFNPEVIFHSVMGFSSNLMENRLLVDTALYSQYSENDLRRKVFFYDNDGIRYKGSYNGDFYFFAGLSVSEIILIRAEGNIRLGNQSEAISDMQTLLRHRYENRDITGAIPVEENQDDMLAFVLRERRKELIYRGLRWSDLRRLNKEAAFEKTLVRVLDGVRYELLPNSQRYVLPIPEKVISLSGIEQNQR